MISNFGFPENITAMSTMDKKQTQENASELIKFTGVSIGTYLSTRLFLHLVKNPLILFGTGLIAGVYIHKNREQILDTLVEAKRQSTQLLSRDEQDV